MRAWLPAISGMACLGLGAGLIGVYGFFVGPLAEEFGVGAAVLNTAPAALLLVPGLVGPIVGKLVDRLPIRRIMLTGATLAMCALLLISQVPELWMAGIGFLFFALGLAMYGPVTVNGMLVNSIPVARPAPWRLLPWGSAWPPWYCHRWWPISC